MEPVMSRKSRKANVLLWSAQVVLSLLFLFAGVSKLVMSPAMLDQGPVHLPVAFARFIGVCETLGALGLVLPGLFRIHRFLTPLAAAGLAIIMTGATVLTAASGSLPGSLFPFAVGVVVVVVFINRGGRGAITRTGTRRLELQNA
jgi:uncharacterized membrane protein YphA (DoxX/SURF4 family)